MFNYVKSLRLWRGQQRWY